MPSPVSSKIFLLTPVRPSSESHRPELQETLGLLSGSNLQERTGGPGASRTPLCLALPGRPVAPEGRPEEEEEDSEDSDESDEELRCYSIQEPSEESEEEVPPVPVVVAESQSARNLRSLLKMPSLLSEAFCEDLERKKKAVSFFDDVTVYLFDQVGSRPGLGVGRGGLWWDWKLGDKCCFDSPRKAPPESSGSPSLVPRSHPPRSQWAAQAPPVPPAGHGGLTPPPKALRLNRVS